MVILFAQLLKDLVICKSTNIFGQFSTILMMSRLITTSFGDRLKELRLNKNMPQRKVAAFLDIDTSVLSKFEKNIRQPSREIILKIAELFEVDGQQLITEALTDKIAFQIIKENVNTNLLKIAEKKVEFLRAKKEQR